MTTLVIARHGNTFGPGDVVTRVGGRTDLPLTEAGLEQGRKLGAYLREHALLPSVIYTSQLRRTLQTAAMAQQEMGLAVPLVPLDMFNEIDYGPDENQPEAAVVARLGADALRAWDMDTIVPPGWLVDVEGIRNAWSAFGLQLVQEHAGSTVLVVTSNGIARFAPVLTGDFEGFKARQNLKIATGALCRFEYADDGWTVATWNLKP